MPTREGPLAAHVLDNLEVRARQSNGTHEVDPQWVPVCAVCWEPVHQDDSEEWVHSHA